MRDHGGNLDWARAKWGGSDWIDLSTGINRVPYPVGPVSVEAWTALPTQAAMAGLLTAARRAYGTTAPMAALAGAQAAIQLIPRLSAPGLARVLGPTYNEHAACLQAAGWRVEQVTDWRGLMGADLAVVVNPNNPGGQVVAKADLMAVLGSVGRLVVDESFADATPDMSVAGTVAPGLIVLRSFGKFYGLAGVRLGFAIGADSAALAELAGPWAVSGAAIEIGTRALMDDAWAAATVARLRDDVARLDRLVGWPLVGGTALFRLYQVPDSGAAQDVLARHGIWSRIFPYARDWIRLGLPGSDAEFGRLSNALGGDL